MKMTIFNKHAIKYTKWPILIVYNSWIWPHFWSNTTQKKGSFRWPTSNSRKKLLRKLKVGKFKNKHLKEEPCTLYMLYTLGLHFDSFKLQHQLLRNLKFYQLHFIWAPLYCWCVLRDTFELRSGVRIASSRNGIQVSMEDLLVEASLLHLCQRVPKWELHF